MPRFEILCGASRPFRLDHQVMNLSNIGLTKIAIATNKDKETHPIQRGIPEEVASSKEPIKTAIGIASKFSSPNKATKEPIY